MITGATAGTHGLGGWSVRGRSDAWTDHRLDSWHSDAMTAETIGEVADQAGLKTLVNFWPSGSWPSRLKDGYVVVPGFHDSQFPMAAPVRFHCTTRADVEEGRSANVRRGGRSGSTIDTAETGIAPGSIVSRLTESDGQLRGTLTIPLLRGGEHTLQLRAKRGANGQLDFVTIHGSDGDDAPLLEPHTGTWTDFITRDLGPGSGV